MKNTKIYTYIYYNKRNLFWFLLLFIFFVFIFFFIAYDDMMWEQLYIQVGYKEYIKVSETYVPFVWPYSLLRISWLALGGILIFGLGAYVFLRWLLHKGPVFIITPQGIMDCKRGFVPWSEVKEISARDVDGTKAIQVKLRDAERHFGSKWRSFFGYRGFGFVPILMYSEEVEQLDDISPKEITKR